MNRKLFVLVASALATTVLSAKEVVAKPVVTSEISLEQRVAELEKNKADKSELIKGIEMHGYMRSGLLLNGKNGLKGADSFNKNRIGRLGNEGDTYGEIELIKTWNMDNGSWIKFHTMLANGNDFFYDNESRGNVDNHNLELRQLYIEGGKIPSFTGNFKDSTIWAGKRYYNKRNIGLTDFNYTDFSGIGAGIDNVKFKRGTLGFAVIGNDSDVEKSNNIIGAVATYREREWSFFLAGSKSKDRDTIPFLATNKTLRLAETGFQFGAEYTHPNFYWMGAGESKYFVMAGTGLASGTGLGRMKTTTTWVDAVINPSTVREGYYNVAENGTSYRLGTYGSTSINEKWDLYTALTAQFDNTVYVKNQDGIEAGFVVRPVYKVNSNLELQFEAGVGYEEIRTRTFNNGTAAIPRLANYDQTLTYKLTFAPTFKFDVPQLAEKPLVRTFVTYLGSDKNILENDKKSGINVGVQGELRF